MENNLKIHQKKEKKECKTNQLNKWWQTILWNAIHSQISETGPCAAIAHNKRKKIKTCVHS